MTATEPRQPRDSPATRLSRREYLEASLKLLWPHPAKISFCGRRRIPGGKQYILLPGGRNPKVMLPRGPRAVTAAAILNHKASATWRERLQLRVMSVGALTGSTALFPDQVHIVEAGGENAAVADYLSQALARPLHVSMYVGAPRANRKPVLQLISVEGETFAFAKIGVNTLTHHLVRGEAESLHRLSGHRFEHIVAPEVLHVGDWEGHPVLVLAALGGRFGRAEPTLQKAMVELAHVGATEPQNILTTSYWSRLLGKVQALPTSALSVALHQEMPALTELAGQERVRLGAWHGDWTPWNMAVADAKIALWDWERFEPEVPWGFDLLHFRLHGPIVRGQADPRESAARLVAEAPSLLAPFGVLASAATFTALTYLVEIAARYLQDDLAAAGGRLGALDRWLLPVLSNHLRTPVGQQQRR